MLHPLATPGFWVYGATGFMNSFVRRTRDTGTSSRTRPPGLDLRVPGQVFIASDSYPTGGHHASSAGPLCTFPGRTMWWLRRQGAQDNLKPVTAMSLRQPRCSCLWASPSPRWAPPSVTNGSSHTLLVTTSTLVTVIPAQRDQLSHHSKAVNELPHIKSFRHHSPCSVLRSEAQMSPWMATLEEHNCPVSWSICILRSTSREEEMRHVLPWLLHLPSVPNSGFQAQIIQCERLISQQTSSVVQERPQCGKVCFHIVY